MRRNALWSVGGFLWVVLTFLVTLRLTFPSDSIVDRIRYEVDRRSHGQMALDVEHVNPWRFGVAGRNVKLLSIDEGEAHEILVMDRARMRVGMLSMLSEPHVSGDIRFGDGDVDIDMTLVPVDKKWVTRAMTIEAEEFPLSSIPPISDVKIDGTGTLDLDLDLDAPDGFGSASGSFRIYGRSLVIDGIGSYGDLLAAFAAFPISIDELDIRIEWTEGKGRVVRGVLFSSLMNAEMTGDVTLDPSIMRSRLKMQIALELSEASAKLGALLGDPWADGKYHAIVTGRLGSPSISPERERAARRAAPTPSTEEVLDPGGAATEEAAREARERRRERMRDRATRPGVPDVGRALPPTGVETPGGEELVPVDEIPVEEGTEEVPLEEAPPIEEPPPEEEAPPPEEVPPPEEGY